MGCLSHEPVMMFLMGFTSAVKPETSGCLCSHMGCHITSPLASRNVRSDSWGERRSMSTKWPLRTGRKDQSMQGLTSFSRLFSKWVDRPDLLSSHKWVFPGWTNSPRLLSQLLWKSQWSALGKINIQLKFSFVQSTKHRNYYFVLAVTGLFISSLSRPLSSWQSLLFLLVM